MNIDWGPDQKDDSEQGGNSIKNTQGGMKVTLSEIKKNLQGTNSGGDEAKSQTNDLEHKEGRSTRSEQQEEKRI